MFHVLLLCTAFGTAALLEQLAFKRTQKRSSAKLAYDIESMGGKFNAAAARDAVRLATALSHFV